MATLIEAVNDSRTRVLPKETLGMPAFDTCRAKAAVQRCERGISPRPLRFGATERVDTTISGLR